MVCLTFELHNVQVMNKHGAVIAGVVKNSISKIAYQLSSWAPTPAGHARDRVQALRGCSRELTRDGGAARCAALAHSSFCDANKQRHTGCHSSQPHHIQPHHSSSHRQLCTCRLKAPTSPVTATPPEPPTAPWFTVHTCWA